ncbi:unnamed protein product [Amoebophrya sp. A25]|nr:unnamed protein product [Amoebophrya sp. A25]|eukprot:GSA25T00007913001.1
MRTTTTTTRRTRRSDVLIEQKLQPDERSREERLRSVGVSAAEDDEELQSTEVAPEEEEQKQKQMETRPLSKLEQHFYRRLGRNVTTATLPKPSPSRDVVSGSSGITTGRFHQDALSTSEQARPDHHDEEDGESSEEDVVGDQMDDSSGVPIGRVAENADVDHGSGSGSRPDIKNEVYDDLPFVTPDHVPGPGRYAPPEPSREDEEHDDEEEESSSASPSPSHSPNRRNIGEAPATLGGTKRPFAASMFGQGAFLFVGEQVMRRKRRLSSLVADNWEMVQSMVDNGATEREIEKHLRRREQEQLSEPDEVAKQIEAATKQNTKANGRISLLTEEAAASGPPRKSRRNRSKQNHSTATSNGDQATAMALLPNDPHQNASKNKLQDQHGAFIINKSPTAASSKNAAGRTSPLNMTAAAKTQGTARSLSMGTAASTSTIHERRSVQEGGSLNIVGGVGASSPSTLTGSSGGRLGPPAPGEHVGSLLLQHEQRGSSALLQQHPPGGAGGPDRASFLAAMTAPSRFSSSSQPGSIAAQQHRGPNNNGIVDPGVPPPRLSSGPGATAFSLSQVGRMPAAPGGGVEIRISGNVDNYNSGPNGGSGASAPNISRRQSSLSMNDSKSNLFNQVRGLDQRIQNDNIENKTSFFLESARREMHAAASAGSMKPPRGRREGEVSMHVKEKFDICDDQNDHLQMNVDTPQNFQNNNNNARSSSSTASMQLSALDAFLEGGAGKGPSGATAKNNTDRAKRRFSSYLLDNWEEVQNMLHAGETLEGIEARLNQMAAEDGTSLPEEGLSLEIEDPLPRHDDSREEDPMLREERDETQEERAASRKMMLDAGLNPKLELNTINKNFGRSGPSTSTSSRTSMMSTSSATRGSTRSPRGGSQASSASQRERSSRRAARGHEGEAEKHLVHVEGEDDEDVDEEVEIQFRNDLAEVERREDEYIPRNREIEVMHKEQLGDGAEHFDEVPLEDVAQEGHELEQDNMIDKIATSASTTSSRPSSSSTSKKSTTSTTSRASTSTSTRTNNRSSASSSTSKSRTSKSSREVDVLVPGEDEPPPPPPVDDGKIQSVVNISKLVKEELGEQLLLAAEEKFKATFRKSADEQAEAQAQQKMSTQDENDNQDDDDEEEEEDHSDSAPDQGGLDDEVEKLKNRLRQSTDDMIDLPRDVVVDISKGIISKETALLPMDALREIVDEEKGTRTRTSVEQEEQATTSSSSSSTSNRDRIRKSSSSRKTSAKKSSRFTNLSPRLNAEGDADVLPRFGGTSTTRTSRGGSSPTAEAAHLLTQDVTANILTENGGADGTRRRFSSLVVDNWYEVQAMLKEGKTAEEIEEHLNESGNTNTTSADVTTSPTMSNTNAGNELRVSSRNRQVPSPRFQAEGAAPNHAAPPKTNVAATGPRDKKAKASGGDKKVAAKASGGDKNKRRYSSMVADNWDAVQEILANGAGENEVSAYLQKIDPQAEKRVDSSARLHDKEGKREENRQLIMSAMGGGASKARQELRAPAQAKQQQQQQPQQQKSSPRQQQKSSPQQQSPRQQGTPKNTRQEPQPQKQKPQQAPDESSR